MRGTGDMFGTLLGWLNKPKAGGQTGFIYPNREMLMEPTRGSAMWFISLASDHKLENEQIHGGCPVLMGSKWILNKWIYAFDQWKNWPCALKEKISVSGHKGITH